MDKSMADEFNELLGGARVVFWTCPIEHEPTPNKPIVEWIDGDGVMIPHCLICGNVGQEHKLGT